jgi:hypothetical protein
MWVLCTLDHYVEADSCKGGFALWSSVIAFVKADKVQMSEIVVGIADGLRVMK